MKIIISESQYSNIFESNNEKQSNLIYKMWNDGMDIYEISELIGLKESQVVLYLMLVFNTNLLVIFQSIDVP